MNEDATNEDIKLNEEREREKKKKQRTQNNEQNTKTRWRNSRIKDREEYSVEINKWSRVTTSSETNINNDENSKNKDVGMCIGGVECK